MKKLVVLSVVVILSFVCLYGCDGMLPTEDEAEEENENQEIAIEINGAVLVNNITYVSADSHDITVTFSEPVKGWVRGNITPCTGDYSKSPILLDVENNVVFFPNEDRTIWFGSGKFEPNIGDYNSCCASYLQITSGQCEDKICKYYPIIIDSGLPYASFELSVDECICGGFQLSFETVMSSSPCEPDVESCGDDCSGIDSWTISVYKEDVYQGFPNYECGELDCIEPLFSCSGTECPIECTSECITEDFHSIIINLTDKVGNESNGLIYQYSEDEDIITIWDGLIFPPE